MKFHSLLKGTVIIAALVSSLSAQPQVFGGELAPVSPPTRADLQLNYSVNNVTYRPNSTAIELSLQVKGNQGRYPISFYWIDDRRTRHPATFIKKTSKTKKKSHRYAVRPEGPRLLLNSEDRIRRGEVQARNNRDGFPTSMTVTIPGSPSDGQLVVVLAEESLFEEPDAVNNIRNLKISSYDLALPDRPQIEQRGSHRIIRLRVENKGVGRSPQTRYTIETTREGGQTETTAAMIPRLAPGEDFVIEKRVTWTNGDWSIKFKGPGETNTVNNNQRGRIR